MKQHEKELPFLAHIGAFVSWCEELLAILSGPILTAGLAIALVALLTDGQLLVSVPALLWVWAISQAIGLDAQFIGAAAKLARAIRRRHVWAILGYTLLCAALGYVGYLASNVFATSEANGVTTAQALARLGMDGTSWIVQRSLLAVVLVFLSGFLRYVAPAANVALSAAEERERLEADLLLEPLRAQKRAMQARGLRDVAAAAMGKETAPAVEATPAPSQTQAATSEPPDRGPTGPGSPARKPRQPEPVLTPAANVVPMKPPRRRKPRQKRAARGSVEPAVRAVFTSGMGTGELMRMAGVSKAAASKWRKVLQTEADAASSQAAQ